MKTTASSTQQTAYFQEYKTYISSALDHMEITLFGKSLQLDKGFAELAKRTKYLRDNDGTLFFFGNGASATMGEHMSFDFLQNAKVRTSTCSETSYLTAISNDISFEAVFSFKVDKLARQNDIVVTTSSSGSSPNIVKAIQKAKEKGIFVVTLSGKRPDNPSRQLGDFNFYVPCETYGTTEVCHAFILHCWLDAFLDMYEGGRH
ncbi:MAG: hypothetical protein A2Y14_01385 [Verrucomicrobia bacterium GWF2_51_19]|nr:MAG: hypothetical protein A2Y14_01385 [Verrucomicrobia bacterium GWF2_51_19]HCJ11725.1 phosphoheptose isomerase [Opitutae bacterium]